MNEVPTETREHVQHLVQSEVDGTSRGREEIISEVMGQLEADLDDEEYEPEKLEPVVARLTDEWLEMHRLEQATWVRPTDCDRLDAVFAELEGRGFLVGQDFGYTQDDALADLSEVMDEHPNPEDLRGYVFYHRQDLERVMESGSLMLGFGMVNDTPSAVEVAKTIVGAFKRAGFQAEWNGKADSRIGVVQIDWKKWRNFE